MDSDGTVAATQQGVSAMGFDCKAAAKQQGACTFATMSDEKEEAEEAWRDEGRSDQRRKKILEGVPVEMSHKGCKSGA